MTKPYSAMNSAEAEAQMYRRFLFCLAVSSPTHWANFHLKY